VASEADALLRGEPPLVYVRPDKTVAIHALGEAITFAIADTRVRGLLVANKALEAMKHRVRSLTGGAVAEACRQARRSGGAICSDGTVLPPG
jgi:hypothetical protein